MAAGGKGGKEDEVILQLSVDYVKHIRIDVKVCQVWRRACSWSIVGTIYKAPLNRTIGIVNASMTCKL